MNVIIENQRRMNESFGTTPEMRDFAMKVAEELSNEQFVEGQFETVRTWKLDKCTWPLSTPAEVAQEIREHVAAKGKRLLVYVPCWFTPILQEGQVGILTRFALA